jgi:hypothetical protein
MSGALDGAPLFDHISLAFARGNEWHPSGLNALPNTPSDQEKADNDG